MLEQATTADKRIQELSRQAEQFAAQCKFTEAMGPVAEIERISPQHPWLLEEKPKIVQAEKDLRKRAPWPPRLPPLRPGRVPMPAR